MQREPSDAGHQPQGDRPSKRLSESTRVETFSDGVFAIAATLLVLELAVPNVRDGFRAALADEWASYIAYVAAFANIGVLWMGHHTAFTRIVAVDSGLLWRNLVLLLTVAVVPFPTAVIASAYRVGSTADQSVAVISYAIVGMGWGLALVLLFRYLGRHRELLEPSTPPHFFRLTEGFLTLVGYAIAAVVGLFAPSMALAIFLVFPVLYVIRVRGAT